MEMKATNTSEALVKYIPGYTAEHPQKTVIVTITALRIANITVTDGLLQEASSLGGVAGWEDPLMPTEEPRATAGSTRVPQPTSGYENAINFLSAVPHQNTILPVYYAINTYR
jgi:hypothetical protein